MSCVQHSEPVSVLSHFLTFANCVSLARTRASPVLMGVSLFPSARNTSPPLLSVSFHHCRVGLVLVGFLSTVVIEERWLVRVVLHLPVSSELP